MLDVCVLLAGRWQLEGDVLLLAFEGAVADWAVFVFFFGVAAAAATDLVTRHDNQLSRKHQRRFIWFFLCCDSQKAMCFFAAA